MKRTTIDLTDSGAPAALKRLETEELKCYQAKERLETALSELAEPAMNAADDVKMAWKIHKANLEGDLLFSFKRWDVARKALMEFDKSVKEERREGEKVLVSEAAEALAQVLLSAEIGVEKFLISLAQSCPRYASPQEFMRGQGEALRREFRAAVDAAKKEGVVSGWVRVST